MIIVHRGYEAFSTIPDAKIICPHCGHAHEDIVSDGCVIGRPDNSKYECDICFNPFAIIIKGDTYFIVKLFRINDNIN